MEAALRCLNADFMRESLNGTDLMGRGPPPLPPVSPRPWKPEEHSSGHYESRWIRTDRLDPGTRKLPTNRFPPGKLGKRSCFFSFRPRIRPKFRDTRRLAIPNYDLSVSLSLWCNNDTPFENRFHPKRRRKRFRREIQLVVPWKRRKMAREFRSFDCMWITRIIVRIPSTSRSHIVQLRQ